MNPDKILDIQIREALGAYESDSVLTATAENMLPDLNSSRIMAAEMERATHDLTGFVEPEELTDRYDGRDYNDQEQSR